MDAEALLRTVRYVTQDPIQNLKVHVTLTRLSAATRGLKALQPTADSTMPGAAPLQQPAQQDAESLDTVGAEVGVSKNEQLVQRQHTPSRSPPLQLSRVFSWQEKVYSRAELAAAREAAQRSSQVAAPRAQREWRRAERFGSQLHPGAEELLVSRPNQPR
jgi:hypothetical protein